MTGKRPLIRKTLFLVAAFAGLTMVAVLVLATSISHESGCAVSAERFLRPLKVCSSFASRTATSPAEVAEILKLPIFPQTKGIEESTRQSASDGLLAMLELRSTSRMSDVEHWYADKFGSSLQKREGACAALSVANQVWSRRVLEGCVGTGVLFLADDRRQSRGVLLLSSSGTREGCEIRLFLHVPASPTRSVD